MGSRDRIKVCFRLLPELVQTLNKNLVTLVRMVPKGSYIQPLGQSTEGYPILTRIY